MLEMCHPSLLPKRRDSSAKARNPLFSGFALGEVETAFLSDACAIKGKQLTEQLLALPV